MMLDKYCRYDLEIQVVHLNLLFWYCDTART